MTLVSIVLKVIVVGILVALVRAVTGGDAPVGLRAVEARQALLDHGSLTAFDQINTQNGTLNIDQRRSYQGAGSARASITGHGNAYSRGLFDVRWSDGDDVWYGAAYLLPDRFFSAMQGEVDILRWDDFPGDRVTTNRSGIAIFEGDHRAHLLRQRLGVEQQTLAPPFDLPANRWFWLEVHQHLSTGRDALSEVFIDGKRVATSTERNSYGRQVRRVRYGIVAVDAQRQRRRLTLWFDRATVGTRRRGPLPGASRPPRGR
ncbi:MAG: hypothetical protein JWO02_3366 [Solirubrobacterales bacterium]|nr:hypothetical protein [Solirubrobacterales bacterium]